MDAYLMASAQAASVAAGALEGFKPIVMPDLMIPHGSKLTSVEDFAEAPTSDAEHLATYIYLRYQMIFHQVTPPGKKPRPEFLQEDSLRTKMRSVLTEMSDSADDYLRDFATSMLDSPMRKLSVDELLILDGRTRASRIVGEDVFALTLLVEGDRQYEHDLTDYFLRIPDMHGRYHDIGEYSLGVVSSKGTCNNDELPAFWRLIVIAFRPMLLSKSDDLTERKWCFFGIVDAIARMARPLSPRALSTASRSRAGISVSFANFVATLMIAYRMKDKAPLTDCAKRDIGLSALSNFMMGQQFNVIDAEFGLELLQHLSAQAAPDWERDSTLGSFYMDLRPLLSRQTTHWRHDDMTTSSPYIGDIALEALDDDVLDKKSEMFDPDAELEDDTEDDEDSDSDISDSPGETSEDDVIATQDDAGDDNNNIGSDQNGGVDDVDAACLIVMAKEGETLDAYLYRRAVVRISEVLESSPELEFPPEKLSVLKHWCSRLIWITSIEDTKKIVNRLGLKQSLKVFSGRKD